LRRPFRYLNIINFKIPIFVDLMNVNFNLAARSKLIINFEAGFVAIPSFRIPCFVLEIEEII